jgi:hypothetical protein
MSKKFKNIFVRFEYEDKSIMFGDMGNDYVWIEVYPKDLDNLDNLYKVTISEDLFKTKHDFTKLKNNKKLSKIKAIQLIENFIKNDLKGKILSEDEFQTLNTYS